MNVHQLDQRSLIIYGQQQKSPGTCAAVEVGLTLFGVSGVGHVMAGRTIGGIFLALCYWTLLFFVFCEGGNVMGPWALVLIPGWWVATGLSAAKTARDANQVLIAKLLAQQAAGGASR